MGLLLAGLALLYLPVFANGFVYDDTMLIVASRVIHDVRNLPALFVHPTMFASAQYSGAATAVDTYRPVTLATFMWDASLSGIAPWAYHLTNLLAHLTCVVLVERVARRVLAEEDRELAWVGAAWFGVTPLAAEAHVWINGRSDVFATLFGLSALLAWRRGLESTRNPRAAWLLAAAVSFLCGLLSKEVLLLCVPAILLWPEPARVGPARRLLRSAPFLAAAVGYLALRLQALDGMRSYESASQVGRALLQLPWLLVDAAFQSLLPTRPYLRLLLEEYGRLPQLVFVLAGLALLVVASLAIVYRNRAPAAWWGLLWFASPLTPVAVITTMYWPGFGRYLYLPCVGLAITIASLLARLRRAQPRLRRIVTLSAAAYFVILIAVLEGVVVSYRSSETLYTRIVQFRPELAYGYGMLAASISTQLRDLDKAAGLLEIAERLDPSIERYPIHLAQTRLVQQRPGDAASVAEHALQRFPQQPLLHYLAAVGGMPGEPRRVVQHLVRCLELEPRFERCRAGIEMLCVDAASCERFGASLQAAASQTEQTGLASLLLLARSRATKYADAAAAR